MGLAVGFCWVMVSCLSAANCSHRVEESVRQE
jgi:hypothetical protein